MAMSEDGMALSETTNDLVTDANYESLEISLMMYYYHTQYNGTFLEKKLNKTSIQWTTDVKFISITT